MVTSREITYTEGALMLDMVQRSTGKLAFRAIGVDQDVTGADGSEEQIQKTVEKLLQELP
jgi:multisubunit Na+/H+ antiporter MnhE subunit